MKQKKIFCKRLLTLVLSLAMVFTSVNFPVLDVQAAVENKYASTSETHGATYNEAENTVTFWINSEDADYGSTQMWFKGYDSYATAEKNHISEGGEFIAGLAPVNYTENAEQTQKTYTVEVEEGIGAYLYYFMPVVSGRPSLEHIIVIDEDAVPEETTPTVPGAVLGGANIVGQYWTTEDDNKGKIHLAWPNATGATSYEVSVDGKVAVASVNTNACFVDNIYTAGEHTVSIVGINDVGRGEAGVGSFTLTEEQAGVKADEGGTGGEGNEDGDQGGTGDGDQGGTGDGDQDGTGDLTPEVTYIVDPTVDLTGLTNNGTVNGWNTWTESAISVVGGPNSTVNITYPSGKCANDYALQFQTPETLSMTQGEYYTLTFKAQSSIPRYIEVCMGDTEAGYARYNDMIYKLPANQETEITYVFSGAATVDAGVKLQFLLGTTVGDNSPLWKQEGGHTLKISEVSLVASGSAETAGANIAVASDKAALSALITECNGLTAADYSEESYANLTASVTAAQAVVDNASATKAAADEALYNLQVAKASLEAAGTEEPELDPIDPSICVNLEDKKAAGEVTEWSNENAASYSYDGTAVTITSSASWDNDWQTQWALLDLPVTAGKWTVQYDITAVGGDKPAYSKIISGSDTPIVDTSYTLSADETKRVEHEFTVAEDCNVTLFFNLGNWGSATSLTISNVVVEAESPYVNLEEKKAEEGGVFEWCDSSTGATYTYDDETLTISATNWNWDWAVQWAVQGFDVTAGLWQFEFDIHSDVAKAAYAKVCLNDADAPLKETSGWNLVANETEHVTLKFKAEEASTVRLFLNLGNYGEPGTITISNVKLSEVPLIAAPALNVTRTTKDNGFVAGVENVVVKYTDDAEWRNAISAVIVNNKTLDASKYSTAEGTLTLDKSVTPKQGMYKVVVEATGYHSTEVTLPVYADDLADENWVLDWSDEFNGTKLDTTKWDYEIGIQSGTDGASDAPTYWGNEERQYYIEEAAQVKGGKLIITANAITDEIREKYNITDEKVKYTSSRLRTVSEDGQDLFYGTTYGRIEAKMELPHGTGYWPAFWALPTNETIEKYGAWASSGELDIMEAVGQNANYVNGTIHYGSTWPNNVYSGGTYNFPEGQSIEGAHVYAVEWEPGEIRWYVDDVLYHVENNWYASAAGASADYSFPAPFDEDFYLLLNLAVSGNYVGNVEPGEDELGKSMKVDYVRVYKDTNADYDAVVDAPDVDKDSEFFEANKVNAGDDGNYIKDPEFTTLANHALGDGGVLGTTETPVLAEWYSAINSGAGAGAQGTASVAERDGVKYAKIDVTTAGSQAYNVQLIQHVPLAEGYTYRLTFDAYTDKAGGRNFSVAPKGDGDNGWVGYDTGITANLTEEVKSFEYIFTMAKDSDPTARIEMNLGNTTGAVYVGNVRLVALSQAELDQIEADKLSGSKDPLTNGEHIYNGAFDQGDGRFVYWQTEGDYTVDTSNRTMYATIEDTESIDDVRLIQPGIQLQALDTYKLTLDASAAAEKTIKVGLYSADGDAYAENTYTIGTETSTVTLDFTMPKGVTDMNAVLAIAFGGNTTAVEIDNVSMMRLTNNSAEWDAALLYPLGGETWSDYVDYEFNPVNSAKPVPADGVVVENMKGSTNNYDYMIYKEVSVKTGYTYNLSYDIKTSVAGQKIVASVQQDQTWVTFAEENITTTTEYQTINKQFTATTEGAMMLKFCLSDSSNKECEVSIANVKLTVVGAPYVTVTNAPETMPIGSEVVLNATYAVDVNPQYEVFEYASDNTAVVAVNGSVITALAAGTATITVTSGTGAYTSFTVTVSADAAALEQADVTDLQAARAEYVSINNDDGKYTSASYNVFNDIFMDIDDMLDAMSGGLIYSQDAVDALLADLIAAYEALELAATADDITALTTAISEADTYVANAASYTAESYAAFEKALNAAKELANADECSKAD